MDATPIPFNCVSQDVLQGVHHLNVTDTLKVMLTNVAPLATNAVLADLTEIAAGNGYTAGGSVAASNTAVQTGGVAKLLAANVAFTASGGTIGPFRYAVLYNATAAGHNLICWMDYGTAITLADTGIFQVVFDSVGGILTIP